MSQIVQDARFALRMLRKRWGITLIAVASLATAIGGNTAVFSLVNGVILRPTSVVDPQDVVLVQERAESQPPNLNNFTTSLGTFADLKERITSTQGWVALRPGTRALRQTDRSEAVPVAEVTPGFLQAPVAPLTYPKNFRRLALTCRRGRAQIFICVSAQAFFFGVQLCPARAVQTFRSAMGTGKERCWSKSSLREVSTSTLQDRSDR